MGVTVGLWSRGTTRPASVATVVRQRLGHLQHFTGLVPKTGTTPPAGAPMSDWVDAGARAEEPTALGV